jgi:hypothetical protein
MLNLSMNEIKNTDNLGSNIKMEESQIPVVTKTKIPKYIFVLLIVAGIICTTSIASATFFFLQANSLKNNSNKEISNTLSPTPSSSETKKYGQFGEISWLANPQKISSLDIFNLTLSKQRENDTSGSFSNFDFSKANFFQVGTFSQGAKLINIYFDPISDPGGTVLIRLIQDKNTAYLLTNMTVNRETNDIKDYLKSNVVLSDIEISGLATPETIKINGNTLQLKDNHNGSSRNSTGLTNLKKVYDSDSGEIYSNTFSIFNNISVDQVAGKVFYLKSKDGNFTAYNYDSDEILDDQVPIITWNSGSSNSDVFTQNLSSGCGSNMIGSVPVVLNNSNLIKDKVEVGKTKSGTIIYQIQNKSNPFLLALYNSYKSTREYDTNTKIVSLDEFASNHNHFLWQDPSGDWQIFVNQNFASLAECGKPVIYLYPKKETQVKVQVDAKITKSEPIYPTQGWSVTAKPNGELIYQNQSYPYLFWEGLGNGIYPDYKNQGTLVSQKDLIPTLYKQLSQLGLNQKESADFMEFWQPKLPKTPYVRLTWLNTKDMDTLAPLNVSPKPDTVIRIFLEFEGLDQPVKLKSQNLTAPSRSGFTLIEWGGLLLKAKE